MTNQLAETLRGHPEAIAATVHAIDVLLAREDVNAFAEYCLTDHLGAPWVQQSFHREWHSLIPEAGPARVLIGAAREHAKSTQISIMRVLWELGRIPNLRVKLVAAHDDLARSLLQEIRINIERNERLHEVFPDLKPDEDAGWAKERLFVKRDLIQKDPSVEAAGVLSTGAGGRADLIIFDDVVDLRNAILNPSMRDSVKRAVREVWTNLLGPTGRAVCVGTVWHQEDLTCELRHNAEWQTWWKPAINEDGTVLWPEKWSLEALERRQREIGPRAFARQFGLVPLSDEESTFPPRVVEECKRQGATWPRSEIACPAGWECVVGVDLAASMGAKAAYTVIFVIAVEPNTRRRLPLNIIRLHGDEQKFDRVVEQIGAAWTRYRPSQIRVENNGYQDVLLQHLTARFSGIPIVPHTTGRNKADERIGLPGLSATMAGGGWIMPANGPDHSVDCQCAWCAWEEELTGHPTAQHSDTVMAMWFADAAVLSAENAFVDGFEVYL